VRVAKIDADEHSSVKGAYGVQGFPTLIFFHKGQQIKYNGQRSKDFMVNWLTKKTRPAVVEIEASQLDDLASNGKVNVVLHGEIDSEQGKLLQEIATADDYNCINCDILSILCRQGQR
jgi:thioredoxin-like negative regulator of GroEL